MTIHFPQGTPRFKLSIEYLEHAASLFAPPGGAVLWQAEGGPMKLVRHAGEPLTSEYVADLAKSVPKRVVVDRLPPTIKAVYSSEPSEVCHLPNLAYSSALLALKQAIMNDCIDSPQ